MNLWARKRKHVVLLPKLEPGLRAAGPAIEPLEGRVLLSGAGAGALAEALAAVTEARPDAAGFAGVSRALRSTSAAAKALPKMSQEYGNPVRGSDGRLNKTGGDGNPRTRGDNNTADGRCGGLRKKKKNGKDYYYPHEGIDIPARVGTPALAAKAGIVIKSEARWDSVDSATGKKRSPALGNYVVIEHADGSLTRYAHLNGRKQLPVGAQVVKGKAVGQVGVTGNAFGAHVAPHLHFEAIGRSGRWECPFIEPSPAFGDLVAEPWKNPQTRKQVWTKKSVDALKRQHTALQANNPDPGDGEDPPPEAPKYVACYFDTSSSDVNQWIWRCHVTTSSSNPPPYLTSPFPGPCGEPDPNFDCQGVFA